MGIEASSKETINDSAIQQFTVEVPEEERYRVNLSTQSKLPNY